MEILRTSIHLERLSDGIPIIPTVTPSCLKRPNCDGVSCTAAGSYTSDVIIDPCQESVRVMLRSLDNGISIDHTFLSTGQYQPPGLRLNVELQVHIDKSNYSMQLSVSQSQCIFTYLGTRLLHVPMWTCSSPE